MSTSSLDSSATPSVPVAPRRPAKVTVSGVVAGLALGGCVAFGLLWRTECRRASYLQAQLEPVKAEAARYRVGLQQEIARTMRLAEELKAKQEAAVSAR
jgi:hypothetical protein